MPSVPLGPVNLLISCVDEPPERKHTRGYIPHIEAGRTYQFVTWRLADSLPAFLIEKWKRELSSLPETESKREYYKRIEAYLDEGHGSQILRNPVAAITVQDSLLFGHPERYALRSWAIMPTHVHCLFAPAEGWSLSRIMHDHKSFTSHEIGKKLSMPGKLWQDENFDRYIRNIEHLQAVEKYIEWNPVKAKLCVDPKEWPYSSANSIAREKRDMKDS
jgi:REP element-mobilizing transposase RayT